MTKKDIHAACLNQILDRFARLSDEMDALNASYGEETKSSAGDKYETTREMIQSEKVKVASQLAETTKFKHLLSSIDVTETCTKVKSGCLVEVDAGWMYLVISLGVTEVEGQKVFVISPVSPIGQAMLNKKVGEKFMLNGKTQTIKQLL